ncbi:GNAT family N-acetyltransferase [Colwellia sp. MSW7]|jgi:RimJ/RimL family protein N-acetyltransferase|uniref:GNAT family N-acetyltransferase n=1 Tax=Colwellia maritima TaxID=2912588 RepID=A0ABS9X163_9GAMM|nr:GNAT family N-acetyltransferase [Colwellia maritima]MCI2283915.1 GNAT family N-acetyltransferase [Colwellia maritima]
MKGIVETDRLVIRPFNLDDAEFIVKLLNEESFIRYIADKNVRTNADAINYLIQGPIASYQTHGFGLKLVHLKHSGPPIGMCGLLKRAELDYPDLGYAFLPEFWGCGYANEAANFILKEEVDTYSLQTVLALTSRDNHSSNNLLKKVGFTLIGTQELYGLQNNLYEYQS